MGLQLSADVIEEIQSGIMAKADTSRLITLFRKLQFATEEFASTDYRKRCFRYISRISHDAMQHNPAGVRAIVNDPIFMEIQRERTEAFTVLTRISKILEQGAANPYEKILGLSFSYAHVVEGVFKKSVQDCYLIDEISLMKTISIEEVEHFGIGKIMKEYQKTRRELTIFEGWDDVVRNAVSHARMHYDGKLENMTFVDRTKQRIRSSTYSFEQLQEMYMKLFDVFSLVLIRNQIRRISDIIHAISQR
ncbi:MAG TPA: hypothetical protein VGA94_04550 [Thermodesulfobacteriota bacterium]